MTRRRTRRRRRSRRRRRRRRKIWGKRDQIKGIGIKVETKGNSRERAKALGEEEGIQRKKKGREGESEGKRGKKRNMIKRWDIEKD